MYVIENEDVAKKIIETEGFQYEIGELTLYAVVAWYGKSEGGAVNYEDIHTRVVVSDYDCMKVIEEMNKNHNFDIYTPIRIINFGVMVTPLNIN